ncbi:MAG: transcription termination/antitermination protein NusA [Alphaproteobacteria bacterium CG_4_9_14_3_um_filter_47_13]|nr:MAG: transcription termination/antitermination protein NusA [Alphaproteobacteria bacterium CG_4_9_14_3_um_filter_47_13]
MTELLQVADAVAREKNINREIVLEAMEEAIQKAGRSKYGHDHDIRAHIDRKSGDIDLKRYREVVEVIEDEAQQLTLTEAQRIKKDAEIGEFLIDTLPPLDFGRIAAQTAKQVIVQKVREAERDRQYLEFKDRIGELINGAIKRVEYGNATVDIGGRAEAMLRRDEALPREHLKSNERIRAFIYDVRQEPRGPQIFLSRTRPEFITKLFTQEVPEIYDGIIEVKAVARDPGSRAKIAVKSNDSGIDPVGACVGMRGSRVQAVVNELQGEKIDIIPWNQDIASFAVNALAPAEVTKVVLDEVSKRMEVVVPDEQLSLAIGRRGQNVRLASILIGWDIDILTEEEESQRRAEEFSKRSTLFIQGLDVDEVIAHLLVAEGFTSIQEIAETPIDELNRIQGFEEDISQELQGRSKMWLDEQQKQLKIKQKELGINNDLVEFEGLTPDIIIRLGENNVKSRDDLADLATDELLEILGEETISHSDAEKMIMHARSHWFAEEDAKEDEGNVESITSEAADMTENNIKVEAARNA